MGWQIVKVADSRGFENDFAHYYVSSKVLIAGHQDVYRIDLGDQYKQLQWKEMDEPVYRASNPPGLLLFFCLFALFAPKIAFWLWSVFQVACLVMIYRVSQRLLAHRLTDRQFKLVVTAFLALPIIEAHFYYSQVQLLLVTLVLVAFEQNRKQNYICACTWICVAALLKLFPIVLLPWFIWNSGSHAGAKSRAMICSGSFLAAGFMLLGPQLWIEFFSFAKEGISVWAKSFPSYSISSFFAKIGIVATGSNSTLLTNGLFYAGLGLSVLLLSWLYSLVIRQSQDADVEFAMLNMSMLLCGTTCWLHYLVFLFFPIAICVSYLIANPHRGSWLLAGIVYVLLHTCLFSVQATGPSKLLFTNLPFFAMCIILSYLVFIHKRFSTFADSRLKVS